MLIKTLFELLTLIFQTKLVKKKKVFPVQTITNKYIKSIFFRRNLSEKGISNQ